MDFTTKETQELCARRWKLQTSDDREGLRNLRAEHPEIFSMDHVPGTPFYRCPCGRNTYGSLAIFCSAECETSWE